MICRHVVFYEGMLREVFYVAGREQLYMLPSFYWANLVECKIKNEGK
jgi:hypothetical protein